MGRRPQPASLKLLTGRAPGKDSAGRPVNPGPAFVRQAPTAPSWLSPEAAAEWRRVVPELERLKLLSRVSRASLAAYCETWSTFVTASRLVAAGGLTVATARGPRPHPALAIARAAGAELRRWAVEFGLTPSSEQRVPPHGGDLDDFCDFD